MKRDVHLETEIAAPAEVTWLALSDLEGWGDWNPTLVGVRGQLQEGEVVKMGLRMGPMKMPMRQRIVAVKPPRELRWRSQFGPTSLLSVERSFRIEPLGEDRCRLIQSEQGSGLLAGLVFLVTARPTLRGYENLAAALARRVAAEGA